MLYRQRDDAKKRAVLQGGSYEDFQNMVSVAHLRPINDTESTRKSTAHICICTDMLVPEAAQAVRQNSPSYYIYIYIMHMPRSRAYAYMCVCLRKLCINTDSLPFQCVLPLHVSLARLFLW